MGLKIRRSKSMIEGGGKSVYNTPLIFSSGGGSSMGTIVVGIFIVFLVVMIVIFIPPECPNCGSRNTRCIGDKRANCRRCGKVWRYME